MWGIRFAPVMLNWADGSERTREFSFNLPRLCEYKYANSCGTNKNKGEMTISLENKAQRWYRCTSLRIICQQTNKQKFFAQTETQTENFSIWQKYGLSVLWSLPISCSMVANPDQIIFPPVRSVTAHSASATHRDICRFSSRTDQFPRIHSSS